MFLLVRRSSQLSNSRLLVNRAAAGFQIAAAYCSGGNVGTSGKRSALKKFVYVVLGTGFVSGLHPRVPLLFERLESVLPDEADMRKALEEAKASGRSYASLVLPKKKEDSDPNDTSAAESAPKDKLAVTPPVVPTITEEALKSERDRLETSIKESMAAKRRVIESAKKATALLQGVVVENKLMQENKDFVTSCARLETEMKVEKEKERLVQEELSKMRMLLEDSLGTGFPSSVEAEVRERLVSLTNELEKTDAEMREAVSDNTVLTEYKKIVQQGIGRYRDELKSIFPSIISEGGSLDENEMAALLALLSARLDLKEKELSEVADVEMKRAERMLDKQAAKLLTLSEQRIERVEAEMKKTYSVELEKQLDTAKQRFEEDIKRQLKQQAAAHAEHLSESLKSQHDKLNQLYETELKKQLYDQKEHLYERFGQTLTEIHDFAALVASKEQREKENRRAKQFLLTSREFRNGVQNGRAGKDMDSRRKPLAKDIIYLRENYGDDPFIATILESIPDEAIYNGVYTEVDLKSRFKKIDRLCRKTVVMEEAGGGFLGYLSSLVWSMFVFDPDGKVTADDEIDVSQPADALKILSKARYCVTHNDLLTAIKLMNLLQGEPAKLAAAWIADTIYFLETFQAAQLLVGHADANFRRTLY
uniref:MICOS complex subunit MIC60 n=1 Tax=Trichuris muris TaxID=70415 RepID=A0A5S6QLN0_TRIMR